MNRTCLCAIVALVFAAPAFAQEDTTSPVDRQAMDTYSKNAQPPPQAPPVNRSIDIRSVDTSSDADVQAAVTYSKNASPSVPSATHGRPRIRYMTIPAERHRVHRRHRHVHGDPLVIDHSADHTIIAPTPDGITILPNN